MDPSEPPSSPPNTAGYNLRRLGGGGEWCVNYCPQLRQHDKKYLMINAFNDQRIKFWLRINF